MSIEISRVTKAWIWELVACLLVSGCEGLAGGSGVLLQERGSEPVGGARIVHMIDDKPVDTFYSDSDGFFDAHTLFQKPFRTPDSRLVISRAGYRTDTLNITDRWFADPDFDKENIIVRLRKDSAAR
jgi:hypothetical protein